MKELTDSIIKDLFSKTGVDEKYFPYYEEELKRRHKDSQEEHPQEDTEKYIKTYVDCIKKGKSEVYAKQFSYRIVDFEWSKEYCDLYATKYEECINKGREERKAKIIAWAYVDLYESYWPEDDNMLGLEAHKGYMEGFEYAIDKDIDSPQEFAEEYEEIYLSILFPHEMDKSLKKQWKYEAHLKKLFPNSF